MIIVVMYLIFIVSLCHHLRPLRIPPKLPPQQFPIPTLPIHYNTFTELWWCLRGVTRWEC